MRIPIIEPVGIAPIGFSRPMPVARSIARRDPARIRRPGVLLCALLICFLMMNAPLARATIFSQDGWGWWWETGGMDARGRGATSVAITGYGATGEVNPATIAAAHVNYGFLSYAGEVATIKGPDPGEGDGFRQRTDLLPHVGGVVLLPGGLHASAVFRTQSDASYEQSLRHTEGASGPYVLHSEGRGGLSRVELALAAPALGRRLLWGVAAGRVQGVLKETFEQDFESTAERDLRSYVDTRLRGAWVGSAGFVLAPDPRLSLGLSGGVGGRSRLLQEATVAQGATFHEVQKGWQELPARWAAGIRVTPASGLAASADVIRTLWSEAGLDTGSGRPSNPFHDTTEWGVGLEFTPGAVERPRWSVRSGFRGADYHVRVVDTGAAVKEWAATLGLGRRVSRGRAAIDLALEYGGRGDRSRVGAEERYFRLGIGLTYSSTLREY